MSQLADLRWMLPPLAMCLVLTGIHGYLGIHVISRKVIFVDLALAQIAALGSVCAALLGYEPGQPGGGMMIYLFSLGFTFVGAAVFALTRMRHEKVPQEAFIGIVYATASALALLLLARAPGESEHIKEMLVGNVLLVTWPTIIKTAAIYSAIGVFHYIFRERFFEISTDPEGAEARGRRVRFWDFLFYASFGLVITSSVAVAGVLLVFTFLVVPASIAFMFTDGLRSRIAGAWAVGTACSAAGMLVSYGGDLPTGPSVVVCFAGLLLVAALVYYVRGAAVPARAALHVLGGAALVAAIVLAVSMLGRPGGDHAHAGDFEELTRALATGDEGQQIEAVHHLSAQSDPHAAAALAAALAKSPSDRVAEHIIQVLPKLGKPAAPAASALLDFAGRTDDPFLQLDAAEALLRLEDPAGFRVIGRILAEEPPLLVEKKAGELIRQMAGNDFGIGATDDDTRRDEARARFDAWLRSKGQTVRWRPDLRRFD